MNTITPYKTCNKHNHNHQHICQIGQPWFIRKKDTFTRQKHFQNCSAKNGAYLSHGYAI